MLLDATWARMRIELHDVFVTDTMKTVNLKRLDHKDVAGVPLIDGNKRDANFCETAARFGEFQA